MKSIRRVIAGVDESGQSVFTSDEIVNAVQPPTLNGNDILQLFGSDKTPAVPNDGAVQTGLRFFPTNPDGFRFHIFTFPPESERVIPEDAAAAWEETERLTPGMGASGMHYTSTIDIEYVLDGEFTLTLDSGQSKILRAGDCIVHCGDNHSWANMSDKPATMLLVFIGAELDEERFKGHGGHH
jgi:mannose-6-phosphate isomerase-like protein (cupin superfamily)